MGAGSVSKAWNARSAAPAGLSGKSTPLAEHAFRQLVGAGIALCG